MLFVFLYEIAPFLQALPELQRHVTGELSKNILRAATNWWELEARVLKMYSSLVRASNAKIEIKGNLRGLE